MCVSVCRGVLKIHNVIVFKRNFIKCRQYSSTRILFDNIHRNVLLEIQLENPSNVYFITELCNLAALTTEALT